MSYNYTLHKRKLGTTLITITNCVLFDYISRPRAVVLLSSEPGAASEKVKLRQLMGKGGAFFFFARSSSLVPSGLAARPSRVLLRFDAKEKHQLQAKGSCLLFQAILTVQTYSRHAPLTRVTHSTLMRYKLTPIPNKTPTSIKYSY